MLIRRPEAIPAREITDPALFLRRREFLCGAALLGAGAPCRRLRRPARPEPRPGWRA